jgi:acetate kinase
MCAVLNGESVATTMGFTPLDGLPMGTRSGSLDPGILLYLLEERGYTTAALRELLYHRSGLLGLSTCSGEMTELLRSNDPHAQEAIDYYCSRCAREIAALGTTLGGIDAVVFTGGIGEHQPEIRRAILERCHWLGAAIDDEANNTNALSFASPQSAFALCTVKTDEERVIATHAFAVLDELSH